MENKIALVVFSSDSHFEQISSDLQKSGLKIALLVTQGAKPTGRGRINCENPAHTCAKTREIDVLSPNLLDQEFISDLTDKINKFKEKDYKILGLVFAYGKIIPKDVLNTFDGKILNLHPSLLPKYRGPSPIQTAILNGETESGYSIIEINQMCDCGDIVFSKGIKINKNDTFQTFKNKVIDDFCLTFPSIVDQYISGGVQLIKQDESEASHSKIISKSDGEIMPSDTAESAYRKFRAFSSWPRVFTVVSGTRVIFHEAKLENDSFLVDSLQVEGKKIITGKDFVNGYPNLLTGMPNFVIINKN